MAHSIVKLEFFKIILQYFQEFTKKLIAKKNVLQKSLLYKSSIELWERNALYGGINYRIFC